MLNYYIIIWKSDVMKKRVLLILLFIGSMFLVGCSKEGYTEIDYNKLLDMENNKATFALFIGKTSCPSCDTFKTVLKKSYKYSKEAPIYYIDLDKLSDDEYIDFHSKYSYEGTPTVTIVIDGKFSIYNSVTGSDKFDDMIAKMIEKGLIKG